MLLFFRSRSIYLCIRFGFHWPPENWESFKWKNFAGIFLSAFFSLFVRFFRFVAAAKHSFDRKTVSAIYVDIFSSFYALAFYFLQFRTFASSVVRPQCRAVSIPWSDEAKTKQPKTHTFIQNIKSSTSFASLMAIGISTKNIRRIYEKKNRQSTR